MDTIDSIVTRIRELQDELEAELERLRAEFRYRLEGKRVRFEAGVIAAHRRVKKGVIRFLRDAELTSYLTAPVIYSALVPLVIMDLWGSAYQHICFRLLGIPVVRRGDFVVIDRHQLAYLNAIEKINCVYCGYANGVIAFVREIAARTEQYWCPIKHARTVHGAHDRYLDFVEYGDANTLREGWERNRRRVQKGERNAAADNDQSAK